MDRPNEFSQSLDVVVGIRWLRLKALDAKYSNGANQFGSGRMSKKTIVLYR